MRLLMWCLLRVDPTAAAAGTTLHAASRRRRSENTCSGMKRVKRLDELRRSCQGPKCTDLQSVRFDRLVKSVSPMVAWPPSVRSLPRGRERRHGLPRRERARRRPRPRPASASSARCATSSTCRPAGSRPTGAIGLLVPELANPIFPALAQAMEARATEAGLATILCNTAGAACREADYVHMLLEREVDGMIFISCEMTRPRAAITSTTPRSARGGRAARVRERRARGARRAVASASTSAPPAQLATRAPARARPPADRLRRRAGATTCPTREKAEGRATALVAAGSRRRTAWSRTASSRVEGGRAALARVLAARGDRPTGVICSSDVMAIGVMREARRLGLRVPSDTLGRRLRRDRGGVVGRPAADDDRAADRRDRARPRSSACRR